MRIGKSFLVLPAVLAAAALTLSACLTVDTRSKDQTEDPPPVQPVPSTVYVPAPPPSTVTETVTVTAPPPPMGTLNPKPPSGCVDQGMNVEDWNAAPDTPTRSELKLKPEATVNQPMVDAPLVEVAAWTGPCFDTVMFTIDTTMIDPSVRDGDNFTDRPWFFGAYGEIYTEGKGDPVALEGNGDLSLTVYARSASFVHSSGHVPPGLVNAAGFYRDMGDNFGAITEVKGAGEHEGQFTFGIGVDERRPFAVHFADNSGKTAVVVRVAHK